jgi:hydrophobic/amphiphilic exporter-1 (mainly G- bacteria), HAE1 family
MLRILIRRPVLAGVMSIILTLLGVLTLRQLPMTLFPSVAPPEVNVTVEYTGANAETVRKSALVHLERAINGVPGMKYMSSTAGNDGVGVVEIFFEVGTDPDIAAVNVQNRAYKVMDELPEEVLRNGVEVSKQQKAMLMFVSIHSSDPEHDETFLYNFADINVLKEIQRVPGVASARLLGAKEYAVRVWLRPDKLAAYDVSTDEVLEALKANNVEAAPGKIGDNSDRADTPLEYAVMYSGKFTTVEAYENIPIRSGADGGLLRIKDVADVEFATKYFDVEAKFDGRPCASIKLKQLPGSNAREVIQAVKQRLAELEEEAFLPGMSYDVSFDVSRFLDASVDQVVQTLVEAFALVALVVLVFLQSWRATLITLVAVPVSLVGTFLFLPMFGFSLNLITLFAIVLAIGIVVDNAIVVVEAVHARMEVDHLPARKAAEQSLREIGPAIVAITLVMAAVFVPLGFIDGPAGMFYRQFGVTTAIAIVLSGVVALTLTPALCASFLASSERKSIASRLFAWFNRGYERLEQGYAALLGRVVHRWLLVFTVLAGSVGAAVMIAQRVPPGFIPDEDQGMFYVSVTAPPGATLERTKEVVNAIAAAATGIDGVESIATLAGSNILSEGTGSTYGTCIVNLSPWGERSQSTAEIIEMLQERTAHIKGADLEFFPPPAVPGYGNASGFELRLLDRTGRGDVHEMQHVVDELIAALESRPEIDSAFTIFNANYPQYTVDIDIDKAAQKGVTIGRAFETLQTMLGSKYATNFIRFGQMYKVMVQTPPEYRAKPEQVLDLRVRSEHGELVPLSTFATLEKTYGVDQLTRYNMYPSAELNGSGREGLSSGAVLKAVQETARETLPHGFTIDWAGISRDEVKAGNQGLWVGLIALLFVYLVLTAQYESFILPAAVLLSLPPGLFGALGLIDLAGLENNIYTHIALVVLIGLLGKNAILIVEFAEAQYRSGAAVRDAVLDAARRRLRPIVMTSLAFVAGLIPLASASGAGEIANRTIGTATIGGMVMGTFWGLFLVPGLYMVCKRLQGRRGRSAPESGEAA